MDAKVTPSVQMRRVGYGYLLAVIVVICGPVETPFNGPGQAHISTHTAHKFLSKHQSMGGASLLA